MHDSIASSECLGPVTAGAPALDRDSESRVPRGARFRLAAAHDMYMAPAMHGARVLESSSMRMRMLACAYTRARACARSRIDSRSRAHLCAHCVARALSHARTVPRLARAEKSD